jgi:multidrug efflux pump subunit AcrA (membrane-fusion protein)
LCDTLLESSIGDQILKALSTLGLFIVISGFPVSVRGDAAPPSSKPAASTTNAAAATTTVKRGDLPMDFDANGYFEAADPFEVRFRFKQYVGELSIDEVVPNGDTVKKGEQILSIDSSLLQKQLDAAENDLATAKANLVKAEADYKLSRDAEAMTLKGHKDAVKDASDAVKWWEQVDGPQMLKTWNIQIQQYQHLVDDRTDELEQLKKMYKTEELTSATADIVVKRAIRGLEQAQIALEMEKERIEKYKATAYPTSKRGILDALKKAQQALASNEVAQTHLTTQWASSLFTTRNAATAAEQKVMELKDDLAKLTVSAPADGVVYYGQLTGGNWNGGDPKTMRYGEKLAPQQVVATFFAPGALRMVVDLPEAKYFSVTADSSATFVPAAFPEMRIKGKCEIAHRTGVVTVDRGVVYPMRVTPTGETDARILPGMKASAHFTVPPLKNVLLVPATAVSGGNAWVKEKGGETKRAVITGHSDGKSIEIISGLKEGDAVLTQAKP